MSCRGCRTGFGFVMPMKTLQAKSSNGLTKKLKRGIGWISAQLNRRVKRGWKSTTSNLKSTVPNSDASVVVVERVKGGIPIAKVVMVPGWDPVLDGDLMMFKDLIKCDLVEQCSWRISNYQHGLIWMDEEAKLKPLQPVITVHEPSTRRIMNYLSGTLVFAGKADGRGIELLPKKTSVDLAIAINNGDTIQVMDHYLAVLEPIKR